MAKLNKLNLTPQPIYPDPSPAAALPEMAPTTTYDVGSGSEGGRFVVAEEPLKTSDQASEKAREIAELARDKFQAVADDAKERMDEIADRASTFASEAGHRLNGLRDQFNQRLPEWKREVQERTEHVQAIARRSATRVDQKARQFPVETILAAAGAGFVLGATLKIWRSSRG
jgi:ElaB/YqjD/DUF883 family membrane-anchored ribosome-binding protein